MRKKQEFDEALMQMLAFSKPTDIRVNMSKYGTPVMTCQNSVKNERKSANFSAHFLITQIIF